MKNRPQKILLVLAINVLALLALFLVVYFFWYPPPYLQIKGGDRLFAVVTGVQLVLGPGLMWLLFKPGKKGLWIDMVVISLLQVGAFCWGAYALHQQRPYFMVYAVDRFNLLSLNDVDPAKILDPRFLDKPAAGPVLVIANLPLDRSEARQLLTETLLEGKPDVDRRPRYWSDYADGYRHFVAQARNLAELRAARPETTADIGRLERELDRTESELVFLPIVGRHADYAVVVDPNSGAVLAAIQCNPWL